MPFFQVAIVGVGSVGEAFRMGLSIDSGATGEQSAQAVADRVADQFTTKFDQAFGGRSFKEQIPAGTTFQKVLAYERPKDPNAASEETAETLLTGLTGGVGVPALPPEIAVCVSLLTGAPGRSNRGRMYLPALTSASNATNANGTITTATQGTIASWAAALIGGINTTGAGTAMTVMVWSRVHQSTRPVTRVQVGNQYDVQRRRQNSTPEAYTGVDVSTTFA